MSDNLWNRRDVLLGTAALALPFNSAGGEDNTMIRRRIPATNELLPVIGLGTYSVFDVDSTTEQIAERRRIVDTLTGAGGSVIDTSPMYDRSEAVIGDVIGAGSDRDRLFIATKVWTNGRDAGIAQMNRSFAAMRTNLIDLMQVHNLRDTAAHMITIRDWQDAGRIRYNGLTHYRADAHNALEAAMRKHKPQFIQINYSLGEREAEERLLPLAQDMGVAVLINRPFQAGRLFRAVSGRDVPQWAGDFAGSWGQLFLKFIISHPAVTCVIPATSKPHHMADNAQAGFGSLPDATTRRRIVDFFSSL